MGYINSLVHYPDKDRNLELCSEDWFVGLTFQSGQIEMLLKVVETTVDKTEIWLEEYKDDE